VTKHGRETSARKGWRGGEQKKNERRRQPRWVGIVKDGKKTNRFWEMVGPKHRGRKVGKKKKGKDQWKGGKNKRGANVTGASVRIPHWGEDP